MNMRFCTSTAIAICAVLLGGCIGTTVRRPAPVDVPVRYPAGSTAAVQRQAVDTEATWPSRDALEDDWWAGFGDERLDRFVRQVLSVNPDLAAAGLALDRARLQAGLSEANLWPALAGSLGSSATRSVGEHDAVRRSQSANASVGWEIDLWGKLRAQRDVSRWEARATEEDLQGTALSLAADACRYYWQLAYLNQAIATGAANLDRLARTLDLVRAQKQAGEVSGLEVHEAEQNLQSQRAAQSQLVQQRAELRNAIAVLMDGTPWPIDDEPQDLDSARTLEVDAGVPAELLGRRPGLRAAELRLRASLAQMKATSRSYYPAFSLTGSLGGSSTSLADAIRNPVATLGAGLSLPFLDFRRAALDTRLAGTDYEIAATRFRGTLHAALSEVDDALSARGRLVEQVDAVQRSLDAAREIEARYAVRYEVGATDLRVWLDARQTLRNAELSRAQARRSQLENDIALLLALGGSASAGTTRELPPP